MVKHFAGSVAARALLGELKESAGSEDLAASVAGCAGVEARALSAAGASAGRAASDTAEFDFLFHSACCFFKFDFKIIAQIGATALIRSTGLAAEEVLEDSAASAKDLAENFKGIMEAAAGSCVLEGSVAEAVIGFAFFRIGENVISFRNLLKAFFSLRIVWVAIRMELHSQLAVSGLEFRGGSLAGHA